MKNTMVAMGFLFSLAATAQQECSGVISDLQDMRNAQNTIQMSLIGNHEIFATTLDSYSEALTVTAGKIHRTVTANMSSSAQSFRERSEKARKTALKLDRATSEMIQKISKCLK